MIGPRFRRRGMRREKEGFKKGKTGSSTLNPWKAGVQESVIMEITGHSTWEMFDRYNTVDAEDRKEALRRLESFLGLESKNVDQTVDQRQKLR
jgi:hypothetical protein